VRAQFLRLRIIGLLCVGEHHVRLHDVRVVLRVRLRHHGNLLHMWMRQQRVLDLGAGDIVSGRDDDVIGARNETEVALRVAHVRVTWIVPSVLHVRRLARIVDRAREAEERLNTGTHGRAVHRQLRVLARRARYINAAITLITISALLISLVVVMLFVNAFLRWDLPQLIAILFILSMLALAAALTTFLIEVRIATKTLRIGQVASRQGED